MNATTATLSATIQKTSATDIATSANSMIPKRIDGYIEKLFREAGSGNFSMMKSTATAAIAHGFTNCANSRYVDFLEEYHSTPLREHYTEHYPQCCFLPWKSFRALLEAMQLWLDLPQHYVGAIPPEQLPWLDMFSMRSEDTPWLGEVYHMISDDQLSPWIENVFRFADGLDMGLNRAMSEIYGYESIKGTNPQVKKINELKPFLKQFQESFFVVAPPEAFNVKEDFRERLKKLINADLRPTTPPDDPLVIKFVRGGCLVVAAWGDEAATLNSLVNQITAPTL